MENEQPTRRSGYQIEVSEEGKIFAREVDNPARAPNPVPGKMIDDMSISEREAMERFLGVSPSTQERWRRERIRREQRDKRR